MNSFQRHVTAKRRADERSAADATLDPMRRYDVSRDGGKSWQHVDMRGMDADRARMSGDLVLLID